MHALSIFLFCLKLLCLFQNIINSFSSHTYHSTNIWHIGLRVFSDLLNDFVFNGLDAIEIVISAQCHRAWFELINDISLYLFLSKNIKHYLIWTRKCKINWSLSYRKQKQLESKYYEYRMSNILFPPCSVGINQFKTIIWTMMMKLKWHNWMHR